MDKQTTLEKIRKLGLLAVIRGPEPELTVRVVEALVAGGVLGIEITFSTPDAAEVVRRLDRQFGEQIVLGMGTLTEAEHAVIAREAGARFVVSPMIDDALAQAMVATGLGVMIGALTPTEIVRAQRLGSDIVKVFPGSVGGPSYFKALRGPLPDIPLMPTGGVSRENLAQWFAAGAVAVGAGSNLCPKELAQAGRFEEITAIARDFVSALDKARNRNSTLDANT